MKKKILCLLLVLACLSAQAFAVEAPALSAKSAILYEASTNTVMYSLNPDEKVYPASTTKLMTAALAMEYGNPEDVVTVTNSAIDNIVSYGDDLRNSVYFLNGEQVAFGDLMKMLLIYSNNTAANILAEHISGSIDAFVELMNNKAQELGCTNTHFVNTHGLHTEEHYTTAADLLKIAQYAIGNTQIQEIMQQPTVNTPITNKHRTSQTLPTTNQLFSYRPYSGVIGGKTGSTTAAGYCLVAACQEDDKTYYAIVMGCDTSEHRFSEVTALFDYAKENFSLQTLVNTTDPVCEVPVRLSSAADSVVLVPEHSISALLPASFDPAEVTVDYHTEPDIAAPIAVGDVLGTATVTYNGQSYGEVNLVASASVSRSQLLYIMDRITAFFTSTAFRVILIVLVVLAAAFVGYMVLVNRRRRSRSKNRSKNRSSGRYRGRH